MIDDKGLDQSSYRTEPPILESREHLETILRSVADGVIVQDVEGRLVYANDAAATMLCFPSPAALIQSTIQAAFAAYDLVDLNGESVSPNDLPATDVFQGAPHGRLSFSRRHRETGEERWWVVNASPMRDADGSTPFVVNILRDATDRAQALRANALLAAIVESSSDAIVGKTLDAIITSWNPAAERLYGYTADEVVGKSIAILIPPDRPDELPSIMARVRAGEQLEEYESVRVRKDGQRVDVSLTISPILDQNDRITGVSVITRDITERRRALDSAQLLAEAGEVLGASLDYQTTLANVAELMVPRLADWCAVNVVGADGKPTQLALAHTDPAKVAWVRMLQERIPDTDDNTSDMMRVLRTGEPVIYPEITDEMFVSGAKSAEHLAALRELGFKSAAIIPMLARGRAVGTITVVFSESGRHYGEHEIALTTEIARRAALAVDNAGLYAEAQQAARAREDFLVTASHELRTPLTSVKAAAQLVSRYIHKQTLDRERVSIMISRLQEEIGRLEELSLDLLDAARIQRGQFLIEPAPCDLVEIAREVMLALEESAYRLPTHRLMLDAGEPVSGVWDARRLRQVVTTLIANAMKYSPAGGDVRVRISQDRDDATLVVEDSGIGIDPTEALNLFEPFERGSAVRHSIGGVGLGLYIARQIVNAHGGTISVVSQPDGGSGFIVRLPMAPAGGYVPS